MEKTNTARGRPSLYTDAIAQEICDRLAKGEPLAVICRDDSMPAYRTVYDWQKVHADFSANIARARDEGHDSIAADCLAIADDKSGDVRMVPDGEDGEREVCNTEFVQRAKLRIETRLKLLAKWDPKRYGDKATVDLNVDGEFTLKSAALSAIAELVADAAGGRSDRPDEDALSD